MTTENNRAVQTMNKKYENDSEHCGQLHREHHQRQEFSEDNAPLVELLLAAV